MIEGFKNYADQNAYKWYGMKELVELPALAALKTSKNLGRSAVGAVTYVLALDVPIARKQAHDDELAQKQGLTVKAIMNFQRSGAVH